MRRTVNTKALEKAPYLIWNAFVDLLAVEDYADLTPLQRQAHLVFWYDSEVQNGGHLQYFANRDIEHVNETLAALESTGLLCQASILHSATETWVSRERQNVGTVEEYAGQALEGEFDEYDAALNACRPTIQEALQQHLERNRDEYIELI